MNSLPRLHGRMIDLTAHDSNISPPPSGVFDWHYLQCVVGFFGTAEYKNISSIKFDEVPFQTKDDDMHYVRPAFRETDTDEEEDNADEDETNADEDDDDTDEDDDDTDADEDLT